MDRQIGPVGQVPSDAQLIMFRFIVSVVTALSLTACGQECLVPPCPLPIAITAVVTSGSGGAVSGAALAVSGAVTTTVPCDSQCSIPGYAGSYTLTASAPGYQSLQKTILVQGSSSPLCGCASAQTEQVSFVLTPTP
jgi:hypothetical protein